MFGLNTGKYGPEKTPYLDNFQAVIWIKKTLEENHEKLHLSHMLIYLPQMCLS